MRTLYISILIVLLGSIANKSYASSVSIDTNAFFTYQILICSFDSSITVRVVPKKIFPIYSEYGTALLVYLNKSETLTSTVCVPIKFLLHNLSRNTRYYYRNRYKEKAACEFVFAYYIRGYGRGADTLANYF